MKRLLIVGAAIAVTAAIGCRTNDGDQQSTAGTPPYTPPAATTAEAATTATVAPAPVATATPAPATPPADLSPRVTNVPPAAAAQPSAATVESARRIGVDEALQRVATGKAIIVDVRAAEAYRENHIVGAINIPYDQLKTRAGELPKDKYLVTYCT
jgi:hypothetical protein